VLPAWSVRGLAGVLLAGAVGMPWLAQWQGVVVRAEGETVVEDAGAVVELRPELVRVPGGVFTMGSTRGDRDEQPVHQAKVSAFEICRTEVTQGQWKAVMETEPFQPGYGIGSDYAAQNIDKWMAMSYMVQLTQRENALEANDVALTQCYEEKDGKWVWTRRDCTGYRLPTETEWEYAARAGTTAEYSFGEDVAQLNEYAWHEGNSDAEVHVVGTKKANPWGLYDMHGNVYEWVWDWHSERYPAEAGELGYWGPTSGGSGVLRGGSLWNGPEYLRSAYRLSRSLDYRTGYVGFRCVRAVGPKPSNP